MAIQKKISAPVEAVESAPAKEVEAPKAESKPKAPKAVKAPKTPAGVSKAPKSKPKAPKAESKPKAPKAESKPKATKPKAEKVAKAPEGEVESKKIGFATSRMVALTRKTFPVSDAKLSEPVKPLLSVFVVGICNQLINQVVSNLKKSRHKSMSIEGVNEAFEEIWHSSAANRSKAHELLEDEHFKAQINPIKRVVKSGGQDIITRVTDESIAVFWECITARLYDVYADVAKKMGSRKTMTPEDLGLEASAAPEAAPAEESTPPTPEEEEAPEDEESA